MPKSERDEIMSTVSSSILSSMVDDILFDVALEVHHESARENAICLTCNARCNTIHTPISLAAAVAQSNTISSRASTPSFGEKPEGTASSSKSEGNMYFPCSNCQRQIASSRYALHLSNCFTGRRGRNTTKKQPSDPGRSQSPSSDLDPSPETSPTKKVSKRKFNDEADFNIKRKRPTSPQTPNKKQKKGSKPSASPVQRLKAQTDPSGVPSTTVSFPISNSQSKVPSKLRDSSTTVDFLEGSLSPDSRDSSLEPRGQTPSSSFSNTSPLLSSNIELRRPSPPRPPSNDFNIDFDGGDETGSSTDTDSD